MEDDDFFGDMEIDEYDEEEYNNHQIETIVKDGVLTKTEYLVNKTEFIIPEGVVRIVDKCLDTVDTMSLERIVFPSTLVDVGEENFIDIRCLKEVVINDNFTFENGCLYSKNYKKMFFCMQNVKGEFKVKVGCEYVYPFAFNCCKDLTKVVFPNTVKHIGGWCFDKCDELKEIIMPKTIDFIDDLAFANCSKLEKINLPDNLNIIPNELLDCCNIRRLKIPDSVTEIKNSYDCEKHFPNLNIRLILSKENKKVQDFCHRYGIKYEFENDKEYEVEEAKSICNKLSSEFIKLFKKAYFLKYNEKRMNIYYEIQRVFNKILSIKIKNQGYLYDSQIRKWFLIPDENISLFNNDAYLFRYYDKFCSHLLVYNWVAGVIKDDFIFFLGNYDY